MAGDAAIEIAEAVKDALNAAEFCCVFTAERVYDLSAELEDDSVTHVAVAVRSEVGEMVSRGDTSEDVKIDVVVRRKCDTSVLANCDTYMGLLKQFKDAFIGERLSTETFGDAVCDGWERSPAYFQNHIKQFRQFTGVLTLNFTIALEMA